MQMYDEKFKCHEKSKVKFDMAIAVATEVDLVVCGESQRDKKSTYVYLDGESWHD